MLEQYQKGLIDLLRTDSELAFTFLKTATIVSGYNPDHSKSAINKARRALRAIRRLATRIEDSAARAEIDARANDLEAAIKDFS